MYQHVNLRYWKYRVRKSQLTRKAKISVGCRIVVVAARRFAQVDKGTARFGDQNVYLNTTTKDLRVVACKRVRKENVITRCPKS